ncbi:MAG: polyphosphate kinase [Pseudomonadota bacterium]
MADAPSIGRGIAPDHIVDPAYQGAWRADLGTIPTSLSLEKPLYEEQLKALQTDLMVLHNALMAEKRRAIIVFEGWDAAGKGGAIKRLTARWDPRGYKVWPIAAPDAHERSRHYLYRFWKRLPGNGEVAIFDRSWYGRVLVERVEGFCDEAAWQRSYEEICQFEKTLVDNGSRIIKFFLNVSPDEQAERFLGRLEVPHKRWKITEDDFRNRAKRPDYTAAIEDMLAKTHTDYAPWIVVPGDQKRFSRVAVLSAIKAWLDDFGLDQDPPLSAELADRAEKLKK